MRHLEKAVVAASVALLATLFIGVGQASAATYTLSTSHSSCVFTVNRVYVGSTLMYHLTKIKVTNVPHLRRQIICRVYRGSSIASEYSPTLNGDTSVTYLTNVYGSTFKLYYKDSYFNVSKSKTLA